MAYNKKIVMEMLNNIWEKYDKAKLGYIENKIAMLMINEVESRGGYSRDENWLYDKVEETDTDKNQRISKKEFLVYLKSKMGL